LRDLRIGELRPGKQQDQIAISRVQPKQRRSQRRVEPIGRRDPVRPVTLEHPRIRGKLPKLGTAMLANQIHSDPEEPWTGILAAKVVPEARAKGPHEHFRRQVVSEHDPNPCMQEAVQCPVVAIEQLGECRTVLE
jgi:hypothetical protein